MAEAKKEAMDEATKQGEAHVEYAMSTHFPVTKYPILFSLPFTTTDAKLYLYFCRGISKTQYYWRCLIGSAVWSDPSSVALLFYLVNEVLKAPHELKAHLPNPILERDWVSRDVRPLLHRNDVFFYHGYVYKVYDDPKLALTVLDIINNMPHVDGTTYLPEAAVRPYPPFAILRYKFMNPTSGQDHGEPTKPSQFDIIRAHLEHLHALGYVHSDVRKCNIVWCDVPRLIDFDLAAPPGEPYPDCYADPESNRPAGARPTMPRKIEHDFQALLAIQEACNM